MAQGGWQDRTFFPASAQDGPERVGSTDIFARGAKSVFRNMAFVEEGQITSNPSTSYVPALSPSARRNNSGFAQDFNTAPARGELATASNATWATGSTASSTGSSQGFYPGKRGTNNSASHPNLHQQQDEVVAFQHQHLQQQHQDDAYNNVPRPMQPQHSIHSSSSSWMDSNGPAASAQQPNVNNPRRLGGVDVNTWEAEIAALVARGAREAAVSRPAPSTGLVQCTVKVVKGMMGKIVSVHMFLEKGHVHLLAGRKRKKSKIANYVVSLDQFDLAKDSANCTAKFRANFVGTEYTLCSRSVTNRAEYDREELSVAFKQTVLQATNGPRTMMIAAPLPELAWIPVEKDGSDTVAYCLEKARLRELGPAIERKLSFMSNRPPEWDERIKAHTLDFHGRVKASSVKNFQLVAWDHNSDTRGNELLLQFGKVDDTIYALDFGYPLTAKRAFAIALASLDTKLAYAL